MSSNSYCTKGREMLLDLKRSEWLPPFDDEGARLLLVEIDEITNKLNTILSENSDNVPDPLKVNIAYYHQCLQRDQRYIDSYLNHRIKKLRDLRWETGAVIPDRIRHDTLSSHEKEYFMKYNNILMEYNQSIGLDLTSNIEPPKDLLIEIRVLQNCGTIMTENGPVSLDKGSTNFLRRSEVEQLIRDGMVEHVQNDDEL